MLIPVFSDTPHKRTVRKAVKALQNGRLIVLPTDTLYGLAADIFQKRAVEKIYRIKGMSRKKPLSFLCHDVAQISEFADLSTQSYRVIRRLAPGAFTFILPAKRIVPKILMSKQKTVGIRIPNNLFALNIVRELNAPIISTTLSTSVDIPHSDPREIEAEYGHHIEYIFDEGESFSDPSTILDLTGDEIVILREGKGDINEI